MIILFGLFSIRVKCDVVKQRKSMIETRPPPVKVPRQKKSEQPEPKFSAVKIGTFILLDCFKTNFVFISSSTSRTIN
jgi:hypothetical protein